MNIDDALNYNLTTRRPTHILKNLNTLNIDDSIHYLTSQ